MPQIDLTAPSAFLVILTVALIIGVALILVWGTKPAYWLSTLTTANVKDKRALAIIEVAVRYAEQKFPSDSATISADLAKIRYTEAMGVVLSYCPWLTPLNPFLQPAIESAVLQLHKNLGIYDAQLAAAQGAAQQADLASVKQEIVAFVSDAAIKAATQAGAQAADDKAHAILGPLARALMGTTPDATGVTSTGPAADSALHLVDPTTGEVQGIVTPVEPTSMSTPTPAALAKAPKAKTVSAPLPAADVTATDPSAVPAQG